MWSLTYVASPHVAWGSLTEVVNAATQNPYPTRHLDCPAIRRAVRQWCQTHSQVRQQDGAEFCAEVLASLVDFDWGSFESRRSNDPPLRHDFKSPVQIHIPDSALTQPSVPVELQSLFLVWHEEHEWLQALSAPPAVLCLQICRGLAPDTKCKVPVLTTGLTVQIPCYTGDGLQVQWIRYQVRAGALHHGNESSRGHYSSLLYQGDEVWHVDDEQPPTPAHLTRSEAESLYMLWMSQDPSPREDDVISDHPQRGLSGAFHSTDESLGDASMPRLGSVLMKYF